MKRTIALVTLLASPLLVQADVKETISNITQDVIKFGKNLSSGLSDGVKEGRSTTESADGSIVVTNAESMYQYIAVEVLSVSPVPEDGGTVIELGFKNSHNKPVRIAGLNGEGVMLTIDKDGYSNSLKHSLPKYTEFTVPDAASEKHSFVFSGKAEQVRQIRIWGKLYDASKKHRNEAESVGI